MAVDEEAIDARLNTKLEAGEEVQVERDQTLAIALPDSARQHISEKAKDVLGVPGTLKG